MLVYKIKKALMERTKEYQGTATFVDFERLLDNEGIPHTGQYGVSLPDNEQIVLWAGMSEEFAEAVDQLVNQRKIFFREADFLVYFVDGKIVDMPVAKNIYYAYKKPRWLPVMFSLKEGRL